MLKIFSEKKRERAGRPEVPLFTDKEAEKEFLRRANLLIERHYKHKEPNPKLDFEFGSDGSMSRTNVWACIYLYCQHEKGMSKNDRTFVKTVQKEFGPKVISDRSSITKKVKFLELYGANDVSEERELARKTDVLLKKVRNEYLFLVDVWESL